MTEHDRKENDNGGRRKRDGVDEGQSTGSSICEEIDAREINDAARLNSKKRTVADACRTRPDETLNATRHSGKRQGRGRVEIVEA